MTSYTPGPWIACTGNGRRIVKIECKGTHNDLRPIATLDGPDRFSNSRLIEAAPGLLEFVTMCAEWMRSHGYVPPCLTNLEAAITKATD